MAFKAKRQFQRSSLREGAKIRTANGIEYSTLEDLSAGGLRLYLDHDVALGSLLELSFTVRSLSTGRSEEVKTMARVVRSVKEKDSYFVGVQFLDLKEEWRRSLQAMVDSKEGPF